MTGHTVSQAHAASVWDSQLNINVLPDKQANK